MEGNSFPSPTEKRPRAPDPPHGFGSPKIGKTLSPQHSPPGTVLFRILCLLSQAGAVIGESGSLIKQLQNSTESKIFVEKDPRGSPDRIIRITAELGATSWVKLGARKGKEEEQIEVSRAQYALIRVFEVLNDGFATGEISCRLLTKPSDAGAVKGSGGEMVERLMKETGCKVVIRTDNLPICAKRDDALVEIEGSFLAVKKALVSISSLLQACQQERMAERRSRNSSLQPRSIVTSASKNQPVNIKQPDSQEVVLKILCPIKCAGGVIGLRGNSIKVLRRNTGASIHVGDKLADCDECLIEITASKNPKDLVSPAQNAMALVFSRIYESATKNKMLERGSRSCIPARLVVPADRIGCLLEKEGQTVYKRIEVGAGAYIQVLEVTQNPKCVSEKDRIVEISGELPTVNVAIFNLTRRLECNLFCTNSSSNICATKTNDETTNPASMEFHTSNLPICAEPDDALVEIEGNALAVKKALVSTSLRRPLDHHNIQQSLPRPAEIDSHNHGMRTDLGASLRSSDVRHRQTEAVSHQDNILTQPCSIVTSASKNHHKKPLSEDKQELVLKILCPSRCAGGIKSLAIQSGAHIDVGDNLADCDECLIEITASKNLKAQKSPASKAITHVFTSIYEIATEKKILERGSRSSITARLVVPEYQIGCLLEEGGQTVYKGFGVGASIKVLEVEENPKCVSENDRVVEISGELPTVKVAIYNLTRRLECNLLRANSSSNICATKSEDTFIPERISDSSGETTNPGAMGFYPSLHHSLQRGTHYSKPADSDECLIAITASKKPKDQKSPAQNAIVRTNSSSNQCATNNFIPGRISSGEMTNPPGAMGFHPSLHHSLERGTHYSKPVVDVVPCHNRSIPTPPPSFGPLVYMGTWASPPPVTTPRGGYDDGTEGLSSTMSDLSLGSGCKYSNVEVRVPGDAIDLHYLHQIGQISGASIIVREPSLGTSDRIIDISGTPDQIQVARELLHGFLSSWVNQQKFYSGLHH